MQAGLFPTSLRHRIRLFAFLALVMIVMALAIGPLNRLLAKEPTSESDVLRTSTVVLVVVVALVLCSQVLARWVAELIVRDLDMLASDLHRSAVAEARGRRGDRFLETRPEPVEVARIRAEARTLRETLRSRGLADQTVLGATVHDLKAGLAGLAHLIDSEVASVSAAGGHSRPSIEVAGSEAKRLSELLSTMMSYLRSGQGAPDTLDDVDLANVVRSAVSQMPLDQSTVIVQVKTVGATQVRGDATLLTQAIANLVANAVRVARSSVIVTAYPGVVRIEDDGPGLAGDLSALVAPFASDHLEDGDRAIAAGSLGLGLYIAHRVLVGHEGGLGVERSDSRGTVLLAYVGRSAT